MAWKILEPEGFAKAREDGSGRVVLQKSVPCNRVGEMLCVGRAKDDGWRDVEAKSGKAQSGADSRKAADFHCSSSERSEVLLEASCPT